MGTLLLTLVFAAATAAPPEGAEPAAGLVRKRDETRQALRRARTPSARIAALDSLGRISQKLQAWDEAFASFERVLRIAPTELAASYEIGRTSVLCQCRVERGGEALLRYLMSTPIGDMPTRREAEELLERLTVDRAEHR